MKTQNLFLQLESKRYGVSGGGGVLKGTACVSLCLVPKGHLRRSVQYDSEHCHQQTDYDKKQSFEA